DSDPVHIPGNTCIGSLRILHGLAKPTNLYTVRATRKVLLCYVPVTKAVAAIPAHQWKLIRPCLRAAGIPTECVTIPLRLRSLPLRLADRGEFNRRILLHGTIAITSERTRHRVWSDHSAERRRFI